MELDKRRKTTIDFFTNDIRLAQDVIKDEIAMYQHKIDMLRQMEQTERLKDDN